MMIHVYFTYMIEIETFSIDYYIYISSDDDDWCMDNGYLLRRTEERDRQNE